ncbi:MAG: hypothetical protein ACLRP8_17825 [Roseburia intestinalis]
MDRKYDMLITIQERFCFGFPRLWINGRLAQWHDTLMKHLGRCRGSASLPEIGRLGAEASNHLKDSEQPARRIHQESSSNASRVGGNLPDRRSQRTTAASASTTTSAAPYRAKPRVVLRQESISSINNIDIQRRADYHVLITHACSTPAGSP